jgi:soluble lytic murein transglycosylase
VSPLQKIRASLLLGLLCLGFVAGLGAATRQAAPSLRHLAAQAGDKRAWAALERYARAASAGELRGQAYLVLGYREYEAGEYPIAADHLRQAAETRFSLADFGRYYWAAAARQAGQTAQTLEALDDFQGRYPGSALRHEAFRLRAQALLETGQPQRAVQELTAESQVRRRPALAVLLAQAYWDAQRPKDAAWLFQEVYCAFPTAPESKTAAAALAKLRADLGNNFPQVSEEIQAARAELLYSKSWPAEALAEYDALLATRAESLLAPRWKIGRARCLIRLGRAQEAIDALQASLAANPELDAQRLAVLVDAHLQRADLAAALQGVEQLRALYPHSPSYAAALYAIGNHLIRQGDWKSAAGYYQSLTESFPDSEYAPEASWRAAWARYLERDSTAAANAFVEHLTHYPDSAHVAAALYWLGRLAEQGGAVSDARGLYELLRKRFVQSYYASQAALWLEKARRALEPAARGEKFRLAIPLAVLASTIPPRTPAPIPVCAPVTPSEILRPSLTLQELSLDTLAEQYLVGALSDHPEAPELLLALARLRVAQHNPSAALLDAKRAVPRSSEYEFRELPEGVWNLLYPRDYGMLVRAQARANGLEPALVMGLIRQESAFNPRATSSANARGLMQILPQTASRSRRGRARAASRLYDPAYNLRVGCRYLGKLFRAFDGDLAQALTAYHAGDFRAKDWLSKFQFQEPAEFLESIPIPSTRAYVEAVLRDAGIYRRMMSGAAKFADCQATGAKANRRNQQRP